MIRVGLTGGIGSGKSVVAEIFQRLGIPVYHADAEARKQYDNPAVLDDVVRVFGMQILGDNGIISRAALASLVFGDPEKLKKLNSIIHPRVEADFRSWLEEIDDAPYIIHEAAILFESGFDRFFDKTITVVAPPELCIVRVMRRDDVTREQVEMRLKFQWDQELKASKSDYILVNDETHLLLPQVLDLHKQLLVL